MTRAPTRALFIALWLALLAGPAVAAETSLAERLAGLAREHGFTIVGADRLRGEASVVAGGNDVEAEVGTLLAGHNHVIRHGPDGAIAKIVILGAKPDPDTVPRGIVVETERLGSHHVAAARLTGPDGTAHDLRLIVDTGATSVVLPASWIDRLGFLPEELSPGMAHTAGGQVATQIGRLQAVAIGRALRHEVLVSFIDDAQMGGKALLGMCFLDGYRFEFDRSGNRLVLFAR